MKKLLLNIFMVIIVFTIISNLRSQIRVQPLGNSITEGRPGAPVVYSYRYELWRMLDSMGINIDMVGSRAVNFGGTVTYPDPRFDVDHEGHWGWETGDIIGDLPTWLLGYTADVSLIHLGTNDAEDDSTVVAGNFNTIIDQLRVNNPNITIFLAETMTPWVTHVNNMVPLIAAARSTAQSPIIVVDHHTGFINDMDHPNTMTWDWVHPNTLGDKYMADNWLEAILANYHLFDKESPTQPTLAVEETLSTAVVFSFEADDDSPMTYDVYIDGDSVTTISDTFYIADGLTPSTAYDFQIVARDLADNTSIISSILTVTTGVSTNYTLLVSGTDGTVIRDPEIANNLYTDGTVVELTPDPDPGYIFSGWTGDVPAGHENNNPLDLLINGDKTVAATFSVTQYTLTVNIDNGTVAIVPDKASYDLGETVVITPTPSNQFYDFKGWTGDVPVGRENDNPLTITMNSDIDITATIGFKEFLLTTNSVNGSITITPTAAGGIYIVNSTVQLTAVPDPGYEFEKWTGDFVPVSEFNKTMPINMDSDKNITANFVLSNSISEDNNNFRIYPVPFNEYLVINSQYLIKEVSICDLAGKKFRVTITKNDNEIFINTSSLLPGMYLVQIKTNTGEFISKKIVK